MLKSIIALLFLSFSFFSFSQTRYPIEDQIRDLNRNLRNGNFDYLSEIERRDIYRNLKQVLAIVNGGGMGSNEVVCSPLRNNDFAIYKRDTRAVIGEGKFGNSWCQLSLSSATNGLVVLAPSRANDFAFYQIRTGRIIGDSKFGNSWYGPELINRRTEVLCAPAGNNDFAIFRMRDGAMIGNTAFGNNWCKELIALSNRDEVCAPSGNGMYAIYRISDGSKVSGDRFGYNWCK